jgi:hypothetical protein
MRKNTPPACWLNGSSNANRLSAGGIDFESGMPAHASLGERQGDPQLAEINLTGSTRRAIFEYLPGKALRMNLDEMQGIARLLPIRGRQSPRNFGPGRKRTDVELGMPRARPGSSTANTTSSTAEIEYLTADEKNHLNSF